MKVGYHGLGAVRHTSIIVALLVCTATFVWTWKRGLILGHQVRFELTQDGVPVATVKSGGELVKSGGELLAVGELSNEFRNKETNDNREISTRIDERESDEETGKEEMNIEEGRVSEEEDRRDRSENIEGSEERYLNRSEVKVCNYANGKWVVDHTHTLYSGFSCKQWLRPSWSCRLSRRPNFAYENLRWQPKDCPLERFEGSKFLKRLQNKTLAFVGDSLGKQQFLSLICMITGGKQRSDIVDIRKGYGMSQALRFPSTNTTILYYCSTTLCDIKPMNKTNPDTNYAMHLDRPASFLIKYVHKIDVLVLNTMHHWSQGKFKANRWVTHVGGMPNTNKNLEQIWQARNLTIHNVVDWGNKQLAKYPNLKVFYRTMSPRHFSGGDWNSGGSCDNSILMSVGKEIVQDSSSDSVAVSAVKGTGVRLLDITALTGVRDEAHISRYHGKHISTSSDCSHWCLPGVPDTWNEILFAQV